MPPSQHIKRLFHNLPKARKHPVFHSSSSGKEKDSETGYYYFGARYYNSDLSLWLSVDPMADKYPSLSPYNYCAWNPMKIVDPDGRETVADGWIVDRTAKTVTRISDEGGNTVGVVLFFAVDFSVRNDAEIE